MAGRACARGLFGLRPLHNASRNMSTLSPPKKLDPNYVSTESMDVERLFLHADVRKILKKLTGMDLNRIFALRKQENSVPSYKLMTDEELKQAYAKALKRAEFTLRMPPVMRKRVPCEAIIRKDPGMQGAEKHKFVFTDISYGIPDRSRPIVVREPNGVLRNASWEERDQMLQTYLTRPERESRTPPMFTEPHLTRILDKGWYIFVLDRACAQFEPDDEWFIAVTHRTYDHISEKSAFDVVRSTRHFGPMCLYLAVVKNGDKLMLELLTTNRLEDAAAFVRLLHLVHPESRSAGEVDEKSSAMDFVEAYIKLEAQMKAKLDLALQSYNDQVQAATA
ncbi:28S ribosomal protein S22, mitochondrial [Galendromus occidentalis]|uniref:28S ribosomal protein S22, mitochondrial n=1 Tax=Galendromus occidentalis TaxID=34638 RepID=A0AAJ6VW85_9ACAR|nr:28S ribosomal protein S22, mitochondrial [Galendromus occidentalis]